MNTTITTEILFAATEVAQALGVEPHDLQKLHPENFGVPGHWRLNKSSAIVYTVRGARELADAIEVASGRQTGAAADASLARAHSLRVLVNQRVETPSRALAAHAWQDRADLR